MFREGTVLVFAIITSLVLFTYLMRLPFLVIPGEDAIIREYYYEKMVPNAWMDVVFVLLYMLPALYFSAQTDPFYRPLVVALVTAILTSGFCFLFRMSPKNPDNFFSKWFHTVGFRSVLYDVILLVLIYLVYQSLVTAL